MDKVQLMLCLLGLICSVLLSVNAERRNPLKNPRICGFPECEPDSNKFGYAEGMHYKYNYRSHVRSEFFGSGQNKSDLYIIAEVDLKFPKSCEGILVLRKVELSEEKTANFDTHAEDDYYYDYGDTTDEKEYLHPKSKEFAKDIQNYPLRFSFHDGIVAEVCPDIREVAWVLNLKKGILSSIQNSMIRFDVGRNATETDISGTCDVEYTLTGANGTRVIIQKKKDINSCQNRYKTESVLQTTPYKFRENKVIWPILNSISYCNQSVDHNVFQEVVCYERHQLVPFSNNRAGALTESLTRLILFEEEKLEEESEDEEQEIKRRSSLLFDHNPTPKPTHGEIKTSRDLLKQMCRLGFPNIQRSFIEYLTKFLETARLLSYDALKQLLHRSASICENGRNHVLESLPYIGSTASVKMMIDQITDAKPIKKDMARNWMTSLSFLPRPNEEMLTALHKLIQFGAVKNEPEYVLGGTAVIHTFCRIHSNCYDNEQIKETIAYLEKSFNDNMKNNISQRKFREKAIILLKSLGNIGGMSERFSKKLQDFMLNDEVPVEIRVQSVLAFRRIHCEKNREFFLDVYQNFTANSEIRTFSYLQAMRCPDHNSINKIKNVLEDEEVNQVGSYVWSHLTNLEKSASPVRVEVQGLLIDSNLGTKYNLDIRKFSRNFEHSLFFDEFNFGTATDANLIFGTDSYLPRLVSLNFTGDLFGESINFFELTSRMEGFEQLVASTFGPTGPLNSEALRKKFKFLNVFFDDELEQEATNLAEDLIALENIRLRRDTARSRTNNFNNRTLNPDRRRRYSGENNQNKNMENAIDKLGYKLKYNYNQPRAALGLRIFGNDLKYYALDGMEEIFAAANSLNIFNQIGTFLSGEEITYSKSGILLDASYNVPMTSGFPLSIHAFGASSVDIRMQGKLNTYRKSLAAYYFDVEAKLKPSVSIDVLTSMQTSAFYATSGIRVKSNFYSSSSVEAKAKVRGDKLISVQFSLPQDKNEIFSARSELLVMKHSGEIPQKGISRRYSNSTCTWPILDQALGLKICAEYSLPDISNSTKEYSGLILCGPININIHLDKADLSAKTFLFEFRTNQTEDVSKASFVFQTPGSTIPRILTANLSRSIEGINASMSFRIGKNVHSAVANYHIKPNETAMEMYFDSDGKKSLAFEASLGRREDGNTAVYLPKFLLSVNDDKIAGLAGTITRIEKSGADQHQVDVTFETKKLQANTKGYIIKTEAAYSVQLNTYYRFKDDEIQNITIDAEIADRSQKSKSEYIGRFNMKSSAYKYMNFVSNLTLVSLLGHMEAKLEFNNAQDLKNPAYTTTARIVFARSAVDDVNASGLRTTLSFEVRRPQSHIDFGIFLKHEERNKNGPGYNVVAGLRYATDREATAVFSIHFPRRQLFALDASTNITIPSFNSCTTHIQILEQKPKDYLVDFSGVWFSNHSISIKGSYQDRSSRIKSSHRLKLLVKSPHFEDTVIHLMYRKSFSEILFSLQTEYDKLPYGVVFRYSTKEDFEKNVYIEVKYRDQLYSTTSKLLSRDAKSIFVEVHLDKLRDIHLSVRGLLTDRKKEGSIEIKWDANRDPSKRLALVAELNNPTYKRYDAVLMLTYPERTFSGLFDVYTGGPNYNGTGRLTWSTNETLLLSYDAGIYPNQIKHYWLHADLQTPFEGWSNNHFKSGIYYENNLLLVNASALWADNQYISVGFMGDYESDDAIFKCETKLNLNSTIQDIPILGVHLKHEHGSSNLHSDIYLLYKLPNETVQIYDLQSKWRLDFTDLFKNITGTIEMKTPFKGYRTGAMKSKLSLSHLRHIEGAAALKFEDKKYTAILDGHIKKLTDNKLVINITTPIEKFKTISGRFGINERDRHVVAEVRAPAGALGIEIILAMVSFSDFNIKFSLATPLEAFEDIILVGKMNSETVDMRGGWNKAFLGFTGVWRMTNLTDFEYSYKVLTPIESFEENGVVVKLVKYDNFDLEFLGRLSKYRLGIKLHAERKPRLIAELKVPDFDDFLDDNMGVNSQKAYDENIYYDGDDFEVDYDVLLNYIGSMELDTFIFPTVKGTIDIEESGDYYIVLGNLELPQGIVDIKDKLYFPDFMNLKNQLKIHTPFEAIPEIKSKFVLSIEMYKYYIYGLDISALHLGKWRQIGCYANYTITVDEAENKVHNVELSVMTPLELMQRTDFYASIELEESVYRGNFTAKTADTFLSFGGSLESDENYLDGSMGLILQTDVVPHYAFKVYFKKDFSEVENSVDFGFDVLDNTTSNKFRVETMWHLDQSNYINVKGRVHTNILPLKLAEATLLVRNAPNPLASMDISFLDYKDERTLFHASASKKKDVVNVDIVTPMKDFRNITLQGSLMRKSTSRDEYELKGNLYRNTVGYNVNGVIRFESEVPVQGKVYFEPKSGGSNGILQFSLKKTEGNYGRTLEISSVENDKFCKIAGGYSIRTKLDWDFAFRLESSEPEISNINIIASIIPKETSQVHGKFELGTPWEHLGIESVKLGAHLNIMNATGVLQGNYELGPLKGHSKCGWSWILLQDMEFSVQNFMEKEGQNSRLLDAKVKYYNPNKDFKNLQIASKLNVDSLWVLEVNGTLAYASMENITMNLISKLPEPVGDIHRIQGAYYGDFLTSVYRNLKAELRYSSDDAKKMLAANGYYQNIDQLEGLGRIEWGPNKSKDGIEGFLKMLRKDKIRKEMFVRVATPFHNEDSLHVKAVYDQKDIYHNIQGAVHYPSSVQIGDVDVYFSSLSNMNGHMNTTMPFFNMTWLRGDFDFSTTGHESLRYIKASWPKDYALFDLKSTFTSVNLDRDTKGTINMEVPFKTRHIAKIKYGLEERQKLTVGHVNVLYNKDEVLKGEYSCKTEEKAGYSKDVVDIILENQIKPIGIYYTHARHYVDADFPDLDIKHVQIYELRNSSVFNITGELQIKTTDNGQSYTIIAIHPNRTVILNSEYHQEGVLTNTRSKLQLAPNVWIGYQVDLRNLTTSTNESQSFVVNLFYPKRNLTTEGWYSVTTHTFDSNLIFKWTNIEESYSYRGQQAKMMQAGIQWREDPEFRFDGANQTAIITLGHPSFKKDITITSHYNRSPLELLKSHTNIDYYDDPRHLITFGATVKDLTSIVGYRNYTYEIFASHEASNIKFDAFGSVGIQHSLYKTESQAEYLRGYEDPQHGYFLALVDIKQKLLHFYKIAPSKIVRYMVQPYENHPVYGLNATFWETPDTNTTGYFYIDLHRKYTRMDFNLTSDASHNLQMIGIIPDARSAYFDMWRNYDEIRVIDAAYHLKMNHSRLVTSYLQWRPKLKADVKKVFKDIATSFYDSFSDGIDFWIKTLYTGTSEAVSDIWDRAKYHLDDFLSDFRELSVLENDLTEFRTFLNQSYEANDFYFKTVVNFTLTSIDELAIRDHIESLPKILSEIWQIMGDSGKALSKSILWLIETIKTSYHKALDVISKFLHGESLEHLSAFIQKAVEKYDKLIKDLHLSLIKHVENLWLKFSDTLSNYWKTILKKIEPLVFKFLHYIETALWSVSKEVFDFIYQRTNELAESPYFNQVSGFTQDLDLLYKDLMDNDALTNFKKYSGLAWQFVKEKLFQVMPFGKELNEILTELWEEIKQLQKLETIQTIMKKFNEIQMKIEWLSDELQLERRLQQVWYLVKNKMTSYTQTALEADDRYREPKTKFIFDPDVGIMELEQKLPISWHAFNETPKFEEIPEYKFLGNMQNMFSATNFTLWGYIYSLRTHLDPRMWLPPYKARSLLINSRHFMTFDGELVSLNIHYDLLSGNRKPNQCSYLLARDFFNRNFTLVLEPSIYRRNDDLISTRKLSVVLKELSLEIDTVGGTIRLNRNITSTLPVYMDDAVIYMDSDLLTVESSHDFVLNCNLQFDICWFDVGGWYFGHTAGILGTMNNEIFDDYTTSKGQITNKQSDFTKSWKIRDCEENARDWDTEFSTELLEICTEFFKTPNLSNCFPVLDPTPFYAMCLDLGSNSISTVLGSDHPAERGACSAALAYIEACAALKVPLRIPDKCVHCELINGSYVPEGTFIRLEENDVPRTTDVVFIVEAKHCNRNLTVSKNLMAVVHSIEKELMDVNITNNRYAVVAFGGRIPYDKPRSVVYNKEVFTDSNLIKHYFEHVITTGGPSRDVFQAISFASKLIFRPGASKTFILIPCSECISSDMKLDYSSLLQLMLEEGINLHILLEKDFAFDKQRFTRTIYGIDRNYAYSKESLGTLTGNIEIRKQFKMPKKGLCVPLAMETDGSVFSARKLRPGKNPSKKVATVFAKRIAKSAVPSTCQSCECTGHNTGVAYMTCTSCNIPDLSGEYDFDESFHDFNLDWEDDFEINENF